MACFTDLNLDDFFRLYAVTTEIADINIKCSAVRLQFQFKLYWNGSRTIYIYVRDFCGHCVLWKNRRGWDLWS